MAEEWGNHLVLYLYDADGSPIGMQYRNTTYAEGAFDTYWFEKNLQGDVVAVYNQAGTKLITYTYDAWGNSTLTYSNGGQSTTATYNPFRYRGYYFDRETGFYYLKSRYYDPKIGRFLNAEPNVYTGGFDIGSGLVGYNVYAYCANNPVSFSDPTGEFILTALLIGFGVGAVVGVAGQFVSDLATSFLNQEWTFSNWQTYVGAAFGGAAGGAILSITGNVGLANTISGLVTTGAGMSLEKATGVSNKSWTEIVANTVADGAISYGLGKLPGIKNITKGRNNMSAVYKSGLTKLRNDTAKHMSQKVIAKGLTSSFVGGFAMDGYYGIKQFGYDPIRERLLEYVG